MFNYVLTRYTIFSFRYTLLVEILLMLNAVIAVEGMEERERSEAAMLVLVFSRSLFVKTNASVKLAFVKID